MKRWFGRLGSVRLTLFLLLLIAISAAAGSVLPQGWGPARLRAEHPRLAPLLLALGLDHWYTSLAFRGLLGLLTVNVIACSIRRSASGWQALRGRPAPAWQAPLGDREQWIRALRSRGFRIENEVPLRARLRPWAFLGFPLTHMAVPVITAGALAGSLTGFVGTQNVHVGAELTSFYNWSARKQDTLPFRLRVEDFKLIHYPLKLRLRIVAPGGAPVEVEAREGQRVRVAGTPYAVRLGRFDPGTQDLTFWVEGPGGTDGPFSRDTRKQSPVDVAPLAYRDPEVRRAEARVAVLDPAGRPVRRTTVAVNEPLVYGGFRIFLTAWGRDPYGFPFVGFQIVRDPAQPVVWAGTNMLVAGLALMFVPGARVWEADGRILGRATRGRAWLAGLKKSCAEAPSGRGGSPFARKQLAG